MVLRLHPFQYSRHPIGREFQGNCSSRLTLSFDDLYYFEFRVRVGDLLLQGGVPVSQGQWEDVKVVQELLRRSTAKMTLDTYTQGLSPQKRAAQSKVVGMIRSKAICTVVVLRVSGEIPATH